jgi:hypothetical protein
MTHRLAWKDRETGQYGAGKVVYPSQPAALEVARRMDEAWPEYTHWVEAVREESPVPCVASA